jgi:hypothetical protein
MLMRAGAPLHFLKNEKNVSCGVLRFYPVRERSSLTGFTQGLVLNEVE